MFVPTLSFSTLMECTFLHCMLSCKTLKKTIVEGEYYEENLLHNTIDVFVRVGTPKYPKWRREICGRKVRKR